MQIIRRAELKDLDFLIAVDLKQEGYTPDPDERPFTPEEQAEHREKIKAFVTTKSEAGWVVEDTQREQPIGLILARFRDRQHEPPTEANLFLFRYVEEGLFPPDGRFCEIFQLWVDPQFRRQGLATRLKKAVEEETRRRKIRMIYTHTEAANRHVIQMNVRLGYHAVRTGPLWDDVPRTSLVKWLA